MTKIIVDTSFSMLELGKKDILQMVIKSIIDDFKRKNIEFSIIDFEGKNVDFTNISLKDTVFNKNIINENDIVLTDGLLGLEKTQANVMAIGVDSDIDNLKENFKNVFVIDKIFTLLSLYENNKKQIEDDEW